MSTTQPSASTDRARPHSGPTVEGQVGVGYLVGYFVKLSSSMSERTPAAVVPVPAPAPRSTSGVEAYQPVLISTRLSEPAV